MATTDPTAAVTDAAGSARSETDDWSPTAMLSEMGVSIWLDGLSRPMLERGALDALIRTRNVAGITADPNIFARAITPATEYDDQLRALAAQGVATEDAVTEITATDVARAATALTEVFRRSHGVDGRVSIEVEPALAHDPSGTVARARELRERVDRPNTMVAIPATLEGIEALTAGIAEGIDVNVTLLFGLERYRRVIRAYLRGLEQAEAAGSDLARIHSVASFFVSRIDTEVDRRLDVLGVPEASALQRRAGIATARLAYRVYREEFSTIRALRLLARGARPQRLLFASTGAEEMGLRDTHYVTELIAPGTVNAMPIRTLEAVADHGVIASDTITGYYEESVEELRSLESAGVSLADVEMTLERDGIERSEASWRDRCRSVDLALGAAR